MTLRPSFLVFDGLLCHDRHVEGGLLRDEDWGPLDGEICRVRAFTPLAGRVEGTEVKSSTRGLPYASIEIESPTLAETTTGYITNKLDFQHLWQAFKVRGVGDDEEVIVVWNKRNLNRVARWLSRGLPGLIVWICPKQAYELMTDPSFRPELVGMERQRAASAIVTWEPELM